MNRNCKNAIVTLTLHTVIRMPSSIGLLLYKSLACRDVGPQHDKGVFVSLSSICRLIIREHSFLPINTKTLHSTDVNDKFAYLPTEMPDLVLCRQELCPGVFDTPTPPVGTGLVFCIASDLHCHGFLRVETHSILYAFLLNSIHHSL